MYLIVTADRYELPLCVGERKEIAKFLGIDCNSVRSWIIKSQSSKSNTRTRMKGYRLDDEMNVVCSGEQCSNKGNSKCISAYDATGKYICSKQTIKEMAKKFGTSNSAINYAIKHRKGYMPIKGLIFKLEKENLKCKF